MYASLGKGSGVIKRNGDRYMNVTSDSFCKWTLKPKEVLFRQKGQAQLVWIISASLRAL